jgi:Mg-chelatase subunit ChlD
MSRTATCAAAALAALALWAAPARADEARPAGQPVDVVICLDVSGSMNGLVDSAKIKLWDLVNDLNKVRPTPRLRVALYSYGHTSYDPRAGWIRKEADLTEDLDTIYQKLNALTIRGGTEYVTRVCRDAIEQQKWSDDPKALKIIFVCGNEPADQDKQVKIPEVAELARKRGIIINPIFCGPTSHRDAETWKELAKLAGGRYASIDMNRNVVASVATPFDKELNDLGGKLNTTYLAYGKEGAQALANQKAQDTNAEKAAPAAGAARAATKGGALYRNDRWDLVDRMKNDPSFDVKKVPVEELCDELKKLTPEEREKFVKEQMAKREAIQKQIAELGQKRDAYIREESKKNQSSAEKALDDALRGILRDQAAEKGIKVPE